jgi:hypothetical protein
MIKKMFFDKVKNHANTDMIAKKVLSSFAKDQFLVLQKKHLKIPVDCLSL